MKAISLLLLPLQGSTSDLYLFFRETLCRCIFRLVSEDAREDAGSQRCDRIPVLIEKKGVQPYSPFNILMLGSKGIIPNKDTLPDGLLEMLPWVMAVTLIGEHRIEANSMNRTGSRSGTKDYDSDDNGDKDGDAEAALEKTYEKAYVWREDRIGESPETIFIRKETRREMLESMTDKQREVFTLYYYDGLKQREIAERLGISRDSVNDRLECALKKVKKLF